LIDIFSDETVYELIKKHPVIKDIMVEAGFGNITMPGMLQSAGRVMTIKKGALMKGIEIEDIKRLFEGHGFKLKEK
jgi:hypothetical protein